MASTDPTHRRRDDWSRGARASLPTLPPTFLVGTAFGLVSSSEYGVLATLAMSALVWSGTAQFAAIGVLSTGGSSLLAIGSGVLANVRYLPMSFAVAPSVRGSVPRRMAVGASLADTSFVIAHRGGGRFEPDVILGAAPLQYLAWSGGTALGALGASTLQDPSPFGLDVLFPAFYLTLLMPELRGSGRAVLVAGVAGAIALVLTPLVPAGTPILLAACAALIGARR